LDLPCFVFPCFDLPCFCFNLPCFNLPSFDFDLPCFSFEWPASGSMGVRLLPVPWRWLRLAAPPEAGEANAGDDDDDDGGGDGSGDVDDEANGLPRGRVSKSEVPAPLPAPCPCPCPWWRAEAAAAAAAAARWAREPNPRRGRSADSARTTGPRDTAGHAPAPMDTHSDSTSNAEDSKASPARMRPHSASTAPWKCTWALPRARGREDNAPTNRYGLTRRWFSVHTSRPLGSSMLTRPNACNATRRICASVGASSTRHNSSSAFMGRAVGSASKREARMDTRPQVACITTVRGSDVVRRQAQASTTSSATEIWRKKPEPRRGSSSWPRVGSCCKATATARSTAANCTSSLKA